MPPRRITLTVAILLNLAIIAGLIYFGAELNPFHRESSHFFWNSAANINLDGGRPRNLDFPPVDQGDRWIFFFGHCQVSKAQAMKDFPRVEAALAAVARLPLTSDNIPGIAYTHWKSLPPSQDTDPASLFQCIYEARLAHIRLMGLSERIAEVPRLLS